MRAKAISPVTFQLSNCEILLLGQCWQTAAVRAGNRDFDIGCTDPSTERSPESVVVSGISAETTSAEIDGSRAGLALPTSVLIGDWSSFRLK